MFLSIRCLLVISILLVGGLTVAQVRCPPFEEEMFSNTQFQFPTLDRSRNVAFSTLYVASFGDSIDLVDWELQRSVAEHLLIVGKHERAEALLRKIVIHHSGDYQSLGLLANAYQAMGRPDSALHYVKANGSPGDFYEPYGPRFVQTRILEVLNSADRSSEWIIDNNVLDLAPLFAQHDSIGADQVIIGNIMGFVWELDNQVRLTKTPNLILARAFEEVADVAALQLSVRMAAILYYAGMQYDAENKLEIKVKFERNNERIKICGHEPLTEAALASTFPPLREVTQVDYQYEREMQRVLAYQDKLFNKQRMRWMVLIGLALVIAACWFVWIRHIRTGASS